MSKRTLKVEPMKGAMKNCARVTATSGGRSTRWVVCATGYLGSPASLSIGRRGRAGGARSDRKTPGGITACSSSGVASKCVRAPYGVTLFPGGGAKLRKKGVPVYDGVKRKKSRRKGRR